LRTAVRIALAVSVLVALNEFRFVGRTGLAFVLIAIAAVLIIYGAALWRLLEGK